MGVHYHTELEKAIGECTSILDVGCGSNSPLQHIPRKFFAVGVDAFAPSIEQSRKSKIHNEYCQLDVIDIDKKFAPDSFDCVMALDVIEHLTKQDGLKLLSAMERIAKKRIIIFTPNGFLPQPPDGNPWQKHKSGWTVEEMKAHGYTVIGINGWKPLRGENADIRFWPKRAWLRISNITQIYVRNKPEKAFQILCIKDKT